MSGKIKELAEKRKDLCDYSGRGFWPVSVVFPLFLSRTINMLQEKVSSLYLSNLKAARELAEIRTKLLKLVYEGDLGEDHTELFIRDHPGVVNFSTKELPFSRFCDSLVKIDNPIVLLGVLTRNEEGSFDEIKALVEAKLIINGIFSKTHLVE